MHWLRIAKHISVSGMMGIGYALCRDLPAQLLRRAGRDRRDTHVDRRHVCLTSILRPAVPVRELSGVTAALTPMVCLSTLFPRSACPATASSLIAFACFTEQSRYGGAGNSWKKSTVHRGMFHSIPALIIASELTFLCYYSDEVSSPSVDGCRCRASGFFISSDYSTKMLQCFSGMEFAFGLKKSAGQCVEVHGQRKPFSNGFHSGDCSCFLTWGITETVSGVSGTVGLQDKHRRFLKNHFRAGERS